MDQAKPSLSDLRIDRQQRTPARGRSWLWLLVLICICLAGATFFVLGRARAVEVRTAPAREAGGRRDGQVVLNASGYVTARRQATVSSKVTGKVTEVLIEEGMKVQEGQILARIDDTNIRASLALAEAQLVSARNALAETKVRIREAEQELDRQTGLLRNKVSTQADYDHAEASVMALKARLEQQQTDVIVAERTVETWKQQEDDTIIRAPFSGMVTSKNAQPGEMISPISAGGGFTRTGICTIVDMQSLEIEIDVNESYINRVEAHQPVEASLDAYPEWKIPCKVIAIIPTADRQKSTVKVRVGFDQLDPRILPEMSIKAAFQAGAAEAASKTKGVIVPKAALRQHENHDIVLIVQDARVRRRPVTVASATAEEAVISSGLAAGDRVVVDGPNTLADGVPVKEKKL